MDYKLIKENFERATENLMRGMPDDDSDFKADFTDLKFEEGSVESHILEAVKMVMKAQNSNEIIASLKAALDTLANNQGYLDVGADDEPEEADYDTETGEFIGEETINEAINIPFNKNDNVVVMCTGVASAAQRMAATLTAASPDAIPYSVKAVGEGPERVDRAIQSEMTRIGKMLQNISKKLFGQS